MLVINQGGAHAVCEQNLGLADTGRITGKTEYLKCGIVLLLGARGTELSQ